MSEIRIIPLGGLREVGKNLYVVEVNREIYVLDCGVSYPEDSQYGIDKVISDLSYLESNADRLAGVFLTHGHEDAIGALPYFLNKFEVPVFGTALTIELAKMVCRETGLKFDEEDFHEIDEETQIDFAEASVQFFRTLHTIPDSVGIVIKTDEGSVVYTGDFKFDQTKIKNYETNLQSIAEIGRGGVIALLSDSQNADLLIENKSESVVGREVEKVFRNAEGRIIVSAVASNLLRIQQVLDAAQKTGRKVFISGRQVEEVIAIALKLERLAIPHEELIQPMEKLGDFEATEVVVLDASAPGESIANVSRMAEGRHSQVKIQKGDLVYVVTSPSASLELKMSEMHNQLYYAGGKMKTISDDVFASGHATPDELRLMINLLQPKYFIPVQGDYSMLEAHAGHAHETGVPRANTFILKNGDVMTYEKDKMTLTGQVQTGNVMIDGSGIGDIGNIVLRDRRILSEDGVIIAVVTINRRRKEIISGPRIVTRGFVFVKESRELIDESSDIVAEAVLDVLNEKNFDWSTLKQAVRDNLSKFLYKRTSRRPIVLPVIMEVR